MESNDRLWESTLEILIALLRERTSNNATPDELAGVAVSLVGALDRHYVELVVSLDPLKKKDPRLPVAIKSLGLLMDQHERLRTSAKGQGWHFHQGALEALQKAIEHVGLIFSGKTVDVAFLSAESPAKPYTIIHHEKGISELILSAACDWGSDKAHFDLLKLVIESPGGIRVNVKRVDSISDDWVRFLAALCALSKKLKKSFVLEDNKGSSVVLKSILELKLEDIFEGSTTTR